MSRHLIMAAALGLSVASAACTPTPFGEFPPLTTNDTVAAPADDEDTEAAIAQLERDWAAAIVKKDAATLDRLLADEFAGVSPTAHYYNRETAIEDLTRGTYVVESMELDEVSVNTYGSFAVAFASQEETSRYAGVDTSGHYHYTNVWVLRDGRWQAIASHGTRFDTGHGEDTGTIE